MIIDNGQPLGNEYEYVRINRHAEERSRFGGSARVRGQRSYMLLQRRYPYTCGPVYGRHHSNCTHSNSSAEHSAGDTTVNNTLVPGLTTRNNDKGGYREDYIPSRRGTSTSHSDVYSSSHTRGKIGQQSGDA